MLVLNVSEDTFSRTFQFINRFSLGQRETTEVRANVPNVNIRPQSSSVNIIEIFCICMVSSFLHRIVTK